MVLPSEPVRVEGTIIEAQVIEAVILNLLSLESLVATKASRMRSAGDTIMNEFGLRRSRTRRVLVSRVAVIGGFDSTSNVYAAREPWPAY